MQRCWSYQAGASCTCSLATPPAPCGPPLVLFSYPESAMASGRLPGRTLNTSLRVPSDARETRRSRSPPSRDSCDLRAPQPPPLAQGRCVPACWPQAGLANGCATVSRMQWYHGPHPVVSMKRREKPFCRPCVSSRQRIQPVVTPGVGSAYAQRQSCRARARVAEASTPVTGTGRGDLSSCASGARGCCLASRVPEPFPAHPVRPTSLPAPLGGDSS